jgi:predicted acyl esterase
MLIERDLPIRMDDGVVLRADVYRPDSDEPVPVVLNQGPYGKGIPFRDGVYAERYQRLVSEHPEILEGTSGEYLTWETVDPERWVPAGYAVARVDSRGAGRSPGFLDIWSPRETRDLAAVIEWAGTQPWSNGKVGLVGISYYAMNQWHVARHQPPHLAAMLAWEGANDHYREITRHGGILSDAFFHRWYPSQVLTAQHGRGTNGPIDPWLGEPATGPETLTEDELLANRGLPLASYREHDLDDVFHRSRSAEFDRVTAPLLSAGNWGGLGLHSRGNFEGFTESASDQKWLEVHAGRHEEWFYLPYGYDLQRRFFDHFLKGVDNGWDREPRVQLNVRHADGRIELRGEHEWPLARTRWTTLHLDAVRGILAGEPSQAGELSFDALGAGVTLQTEPLAEATEITGPLAVRLRVSSSTSDADLFVTFRAFRSDGTEVEFTGASGPRCPLSQGWLRASHRRLDQARSRPWRPYHSHDQRQPLTPGQSYDLDLELWPTCVVLPAGSRLALTLGGKDFEREDGTGSIPFFHRDPADRPKDVFGGVTTIHTGGGGSFLLVPGIPPAPR